MDSYMFKNTKECNEIKHYICCLEFGMLCLHRAELCVNSAILLMRNTEVVKKAPFKVMKLSKNEICAEICTLFATISYPGKTFRVTKAVVPSSLWTRLLIILLDELCFFGLVLSSDTIEFSSMPVSTE